jgi:hypothetical protein
VALASAIVSDHTPLPSVRGPQRTRTLDGIGRLAPLVVSERPRRAPARR